MHNLDSKSHRSREVLSSIEKHEADRRLAGELIDGQSDAWRKFVQTYARMIRSRVADVATSFGRGHDASGIDDATAEVFAALLNNNSAALRAFEGRSSLGTYLAVVATRCATRAYSARRLALAADQPQDSSATGESSAQQDPSHHDPSHRIVAEERKEQIARVLENLPLKQRRVVELFHLKGHSYAEISRLLQMPVGSVGVTLKRSEAKIRELLEPD